MHNEICLTVCYCVIHRTIGLLTSSNIAIACLLKLQKLKLYACVLSNILFGNTLLVQNYIVWIKFKCLLYRMGDILQYRYLNFIYVNARRIKKENMVLRKTN